MTLQEAEAWIAHYHDAPKPDELSAVLHSLAGTNALKGQRVGVLAWLSPATAWDRHPDAPIITFVSRVFAQNPSRIAEWLRDLSDIKEGQQRSIWLAACLSGAEGVGALLERQAEKTSKGAVRFVRRLLSPRQTSVEALPLDTPLVLDMLWAAFFATGDEKYVMRLLEAVIGLLSPPRTRAFVLGQLARWSLVSNARQHARVRAILTAAIPHASEGMRTILKALLTDAADPMPR